METVSVTKPPANHTVTEQPKQAQSSMRENIAQLVILLAGTASVALLAFDKKIGFVVGLVMQPFWFYTSWNHSQWGVYSVSFLYTGSYLIGIYRWRYPKEEPPIPIDRNKRR